MNKKLSIFAVAVLIVALALVGCANTDTPRSDAADSPAAGVTTGDYDAGEGYYADKIAVPAVEATGESLGVAQIPHLINEDFPDCLSCHNNDNYMGLLEDHASYTDDLCLSCHQPMDEEVKDFDPRPRREREAEAAAQAQQ
jgi:hypothetical protein